MKTMTLATITTIKNLIVAKEDRLHAIYNQLDSLKLDPATNPTKTQVRKNRKLFDELEKEACEIIRFLAKARKQIKAFYAPAA